MSGGRRGVSHVAEPSAAHDQTLIRQTLDSYAAAIHVRNAQAAIACLSDDIVAYDLAPPLALTGAAARDAVALQKWFDT